MSDTARDGADGGAGVALRADVEILSNADEGGGNRRLVLRVPGWTRADPGQFVMVSAGARTGVPRTDPLLPRPMAVYRCWGQPDGADVEIFYKVVGRGTGLLAEARAGQRVRIVGPLGCGFPDPDEGTRAILVGGGTGIASLWMLAGRASRLGPTRVVLGGRSARDLMGRDDFETLGVDLRFATEDGSLGHRGLVTEVLEQTLAEGADQTVYACGPTPMMRRCAELAAGAGVRCHVSLENSMACGFGVCLGCAVPRTGPGYALVCREGPVFDATAVDWEGLP